MHLWGAVAQDSPDLPRRTSRPGLCGRPRAVWPWRVAASSRAALLAAGSRSVIVPNSRGPSRPGGRHQQRAKRVRCLPGLGTVVPLLMCGRRHRGVRDRGEPEGGGCGHGTRERSPVAAAYAMGAPGRSESQPVRLVWRPARGLQRNDDSRRPAGPNACCLVEGPGNRARCSLTDQTSAGRR